MIKIKPALKKLKNDAIYAGILLLIKVLRSMDRKNAIAFMRHMGRLAFMLAHHERESTMKNLTHAFGHEKTEAEIHNLAKRVFRNLSTCAADAIRLPLMVEDGSIDRLVTTEDFHYFTQEAEKKKGVIIMTGHFSNWELLGTWVVRQGYPIKVVAKKSYDPRLDKLIVDYRNQAGYANTARGHAMKSVVEGLMQGETYGLLFDLDTKVKGVFVNFFGRPAHTAIVPAMLSAKLNVSVVPIFIRLTRDDTYIIQCLEPLRFENTGDPEKDIVTNTQICSDTYEKMIRAYPDQWIWMHRRWKKKPENFTD